LQPTSLGTLSISPNGLSSVSQAQAVAPQPRSVAPQLPQPVSAYPQSAPIAAVAPRQTTTLPIGYTGVVASTAQNQPATAWQNQPGQVGQAPPMPTKPPEVQALASVGGVLTPYGKVVIEPFLEYSRSSVNTFIVGGVEEVSTVIIGSIEANRTARDFVSSGVTARVGVSDRLELEVKAPFVWRQDSVSNTIPNQNNLTTTTIAQGYGLGDLEAAAHYQINDGHEDWPFFIGNMRFKSDTGSSPYRAEFNSDGSAHTLATGSGFMAVEPSVTVIYPSDPATLFANLGYIHSFSETINGNVGGTFIGKVEPGDTYSAALGMGVALNDRLSFTLGYEHDYVRPTLTQVTGGTQQSQSLQVGSALSGISFRVNPRTSIALNLAAGVTKDAPDAVVSLRVPITLQAF
jgi:hypothetical protein